MSLLRRFAPSLVTRLALALAFVGLVPVAILAFRLVGLNRTAMSRQVVSTQVMFARGAAEQVSSFVATQIVLAKSLAGNPALSDPRSTPAQTLLFENLQAWSGLGVLGLALVDDQGRQALVAQVADKEIKQRVSRALALPPGSTVVALPDSPHPLVRTSAQLPGAIGFVWVVADGEPLSKALDSFEFEKGTLEVALTAADGTDLVGSSEGFPQAMFAEARSRYLHGARLEFEDAGKEWLGSFAFVEETDWIVLSRQPTEVAHHVALDMTHQAWIAVGLVTLTVAALSTFAYGSVIRPMRELARAQRRLAGLDREAGGGNEIEQLRASFEALEKRLQQQGELDEVFLGRYQVLDVLGTGAMGTVFLGRDPKLERRVAIKTVRLGRRLGQKQKKDLLSRLLQEAVTTAQFNHPNIVSVYDIEDTSEAAFVAMEYVDGTNLEQLVWKVERLAAGQVMSLGAAVARGLAAAHEHGLVHRDVKPANILLGKDGSIKVTDFGIAELLSSVAPESDVVFGTPGYLPPEALRGQRYDATGDLFSLGAVLYFCLTGRRAFEGKTVKEVIRKTLFSKVAKPSSIVSDIPTALDDLVVHLLSAKSSARPADAGAVAEQLEDFAQQSGARWQVPQEVFDSADRVASGSAYLPTTPMKASEG